MGSISSFEDIARVAARLEQFLDGQESMQVDPVVSRVASAARPEEKRQILRRVDLKTYLNVGEGKLTDLLHGRIKGLPAFPDPVLYGHNGSTAWRRDDVDRWIAQLPTVGAGGEVAAPPVAQLGPRRIDLDR